MKRIKRILVILLVICMTVSPCVVTQAAKKSSTKYTIKLNKSVYTLKKGKTIKLKATLNKAAKKKKVQWSSKNKKVATVSKNGKVKAKKNGKTTIVAKIKGTKIKAQCKIIVGTPVKKITLNKSNVTLKVGESFKVVPTLSPKKPSVKKVSYKSSNPAVATVSSKGEIKAIKEGTAKITVTSTDGTGKKAVCTVSVGKAYVSVSSIALGQSNVTLEPGKETKLTATVQPSNATDKSVTWRSSDDNVVTVKNDGTIKAVREGNATITATAADGKSATCTVRVSYSNKVSNQSELENALSSKMITDIVYTSNTKEVIEIPHGDYTTKTIEINAPNADVINNGSFSKVTINAIANDTYTENSNNIIYFNALTGHIVIGENGIATINLNSEGGQTVEIENNGYINDINVPGKTTLEISGINVISVTLGAGAEDSNIMTSSELNVMASVQWNMAILPGGENTTATVDNNSCIPVITGIGYIPVKIVADNDLVNVPAEMNGELGIDKKVEVSGNVQQLEIEDESLFSWQDSQGANVYIIPYSVSNKDLETNYENYINNVEPATVTDEYGYYWISDVTIGNYWMVFEKENYRTVVKKVFITSVNTDSYSCGQTSLLSENVASCEDAEYISGTIIDGLTGESVSEAGILVKLRAGSGNIIGETIATTTTDEYGTYKFENIPAGVYTIEASDLRQDLPEDAIRYNSASTDIVVAKGYLETDNYNLVMNQQMHSITGKGQVQFTLSWGTEESGASADIDSHLIGPKANGNGMFHVYYGDDYYYADDERMADLDVDDTDYEGPEHTTIYKETNGIYRFYIRNYSERDEADSDMMSKSSIKVVVTIGTNSYTYYCPNQKGNLWYVCDYNSVTNTIIPKNVMSDFLNDEEYVGMSQEEIDNLYLEEYRNEALYEANSFKEFMFIFDDNESKAYYMNLVEDYLKQIENSTSIEELSEIDEAIEELRYDEVYLIYPYVMGTELDDYYFETEYDFDDDDNIINSYAAGYCYINYEDVGDLTFYYDYDDATVLSVTELENNPDYSYLVKVKLEETGLEYTIHVRLIKNSLQMNLLNQISTCEEYLNYFEPGERINEIRNRISELKEEASEDIDSEKADEILSELWTIENELSDGFYIDWVSSDGNISDWWTDTVYEYDDNDNVIGARKLLGIERYDDVTDEDILDKLQVELEDEDFTYEIERISEGDYKAVIRITNPENGLTKNYYVKIWEY